jgi:hypothetical protein
LSVKSSGWEKISDKKNENAGKNDNGLRKPFIAR